MIQAAHWQGCAHKELERTSCLCHLKAKMAVLDCCCPSNSMEPLQPQAGLPHVHGRRAACLMHLPLWEQKREGCVRLVEALPATDAVKKDAGLYPALAPAVALYEQPIMPRQLLQHQTST